MEKKELSKFKLCHNNLTIEMCFSYRNIRIKVTPFERIHKNERLNLGSLAFIKEMHAHRNRLNKPSAIDPS